jgi:hypothetical protein
MLKPIKDTETLKRYSQPPGAPVDEDLGLSGTISTFPSSPLDIPSATFDSNLKRRQENHQKLIAWKIFIQTSITAGYTSMKPASMPDQVFLIGVVISAIFHH